MPYVPEWERTHNVDKPYLGTGTALMSDNAEKDNKQERQKEKGAYKFFLTNGALLTTHFN